MTQEMAKKYWVLMKKWGESPEGTKIWMKCCDDCEWGLNNHFNFEPDCVYVIDNEWAELLKAQIDGKQLQFNMRHPDDTDEEDLWIDKELKFIGEQGIGCGIPARWRVKPEAEFPVYRRSKEKGIIVKFTGPKEGEVVMGNNPILPIGHTSTRWVRYDDKSTWEEVPTVTIDGETFYDTQPVWAWIEEEPEDKYLRFFDAINKKVFIRLGGSRNGADWDHYAPVKCTEDWMIEAWKELKL